jgi:hypothetical protein
MFGEQLKNILGKPKPVPLTAAGPAIRSNRAFRPAMPFGRGNRCYQV